MILEEAVTATGMAGFVSGLTADGAITAASVWSTIVPIAGFIGALVLIKLGYNQLRKTTNNATRPNSKKVM